MTTSTAAFRLARIDGAGLFQLPLLDDGPEAFGGVGHQNLDRCPELAVFRRQRP